ncbi:hypothetical protein [Vibrio zhanjiangensis]|nr:hypothetical protein [Vibrio zhanjiangensis]
MKLIKLVSIVALLSSSYSFAQNSDNRESEVIKHEAPSFALGPWDRIS